MPRSAPSRGPTVSIDNWGESKCGPKAGFDLARRALRSRVEDVKADVQTLDQARFGVSDLVLFRGVLYQLRHPLPGPAKATSVCADMPILETHVDLLDLGRPAMAFYPGNELARDPTNWWGTNTAAVKAMLRTVGFRSVEPVHKTARGSLPHRVLRAGHDIVSKGHGLGDTRRWGRMVFHAWKHPSRSLSAVVRQRHRWSRRKRSPAGPPRTRFSGMIGLEWRR